MRVLLFGTYDTSMHPRVATIAEGLAASGLEVAECNAPLGLDTAARVDMLARPWTAPLLVLRLARRWTTLAAAARRRPRPDVVVVGYLGHFDVHLARLVFRRVPIVLDHLVGASDTGRDRQLDGGPRQALLRLIDAAALRAASVIVVDTDEHLAALPPRYRSRAVVVPVGAPAAWTAAACQVTASAVWSVLIAANPGFKVTASSPLVRVALDTRNPAAAVTLRVTVALVAEFTVSAVTVIPVPKVAVVVPCEKCVFWPVRATARACVP